MQNIDDALIYMQRRNHGTISGDKNRPSKTVSAENLNPDIAIGELAERWGHCFEWDEHCLKGYELEPFRLEGDEICDAAVQTLNAKGEDQLSAIESYVEAAGKLVNMDDTDDPILAFWAQITQPLPESLETTNMTHRALTPNYDTSLNTFPCLSDGQGVFWRYSTPLITAMFHFSLVGELNFTGRRSNGL